MKNQSQTIEFQESLGLAFGLLNGAIICTPIWYGLFIFLT
jgi:hypothetical protein